jgi:cyclase
VILGWLFLLSIFALPLLAQELRPAPERVKLTEGVFALVGADLSANSGLIIGQNGSMLIDAGYSAEDLVQLTGNLNELSAPPLRWAVLTHPHRDHTGGLSGLPNGIEVFASIHTHRQLLGNPETAGAVEHFKWNLISGRNILSLDAGVLSLIEVVQVRPAHTPGDLYVYLPEQGILFAGDLLFTAYPPYMGECNIKGWLSVMDELISLKASIVVPGHGKVGDAGELGREKAFLQDMQAQVGKLFASGISPQEAVKQLDLGKYADRLFAKDRQEKFLQTMIESLWKQVGKKR